MGELDHGAARDDVGARSVLQRLIHVGSHLERDERARRRLVVNNGIAVTLSVNVGLYGALLFALGLRSLALSLIPAALGYLAPLWLSQRGHFKLARFILVTLGSTLSFAYVVAVGVRGEVSLFFAGTCVPLVVCGLHERALLAWGIALPIAYAATILVFGDAIMGPPLLTPHAEFSVRVILMIGTHAILLAMVLSFVLSNARAEQRLQHQTDALELLSTVAITANEAVSANVALPRILELIAQFTDSTVGHAWLLDKDGAAGGASWYVSDGRRFDQFKRMYEAAPMVDSAGIFGRVVATRRWQWTSDLRRDAASPHATLASEHGLLSCFAFPILADDEVALVLELFSERATPPDAVLVALMGSIGTQLERVIARERNAAKAHALAVTDELTGLHNRRGFLAIATQQLRASSRRGETSALIFADLDGLKRVNDTLGHKAGDGLIARFAAVLVSTFRDADVCARLGGDEFVAFLTASAEGVAIAVSRLERNVANHNATHPDVTPISVSLGIVEVPPAGSESVEALIARADSVMYENKRARRIDRTTADPG